MVGQKFGRVLVITRLPINLPFLPTAFPPYTQPVSEYATILNIKHHISNATLIYYRDSHDPAATPHSCMGWFQNIVHMKFH